MPRASPKKKARIDIPMPNIIAVVAVFEIQPDMKAVTAPYARRMRLGWEPTHGSDITE
jgi:hypothetical protein